jgi:hypothetical protein
MNNELESMWKEAMVKSKSKLSRYSHFSGKGREKIAPTYS